MTGSGHIPDYAVSRVPVRDEQEAANAASSARYWIENVEDISTDILILWGDEEEHGRDPSEINAYVPGLIALYEDKGYMVHVMKDSDYGSYMDYEALLARHLDLAMYQNAGVCEIIAFGVLSERNRFPGYLWQKWRPPYWDHTFLDPVVRPYLLSAWGCDMSDIDRDFGGTWTLAEYAMLVYPEKPSAVAWGSHSRGNYGRLHLLFEEEYRFFRFRTSNTLECFHKARTSFMTKYQEPEAWDYARSLFHLGFPVPFPSLGYSTVPSEPAEVRLGRPTLVTYPNPFNPSVTVRYSLDQPSDVSIKVFDVRGRHVITLVENKTHEPDTWESQWLGVDSKGEPVAAERPKHGSSFWPNRLRTWSRSIGRIAVWNPLP
jgi:hypothetical protein